MASTYLGPWCNQTEIHDIPTLVLGLTGTLIESRQICSLGTIFFLIYQESGSVSLNEGFCGYQVFFIVKISLQLSEPYIAWGTPNLKSVRELIYKRGFVKVSFKNAPNIG